MARTDDQRWRSIALSGIETQSRWLRASAQSISNYVGMLTFRPKYETKAEAGLEEAEEALQSALVRVREARRLFQKLKVEK